jgi:hypothetical protein
MHRHADESFNELRDNEYFLDDAQLLCNASKDTVFVHGNVSAWNNQPRYAGVLIVCTIIDVNGLHIVVGDSARQHYKVMVLRSILNVKDNTVFQSLYVISRVNFKTILNIQDSYWSVLQKLKTERGLTDDELEIESDIMLMTFAEDERKNDSYSEYFITKYLRPLTTRGAHTA